MTPFKEKNEFESAQIHVREELRILWYLLIILEFGQPFGGTQRRNNAGQGLPLGNGQTGFGEPCRAANDHHQKDETGEAPEPNRNRAGERGLLCVFCRVQDSEIGRRFAHAGFLEWRMAPRWRKGSCQAAYSGGMCP